MDYDHLTNPQYGSPDIQYGLYNFHREDDLERLTEILCSGTSDAVLLAGETGIGRSYFLEAAYHRARTAGFGVTVLPLDLDGLEPESPQTRHSPSWDFVVYRLKEQKDKNDAQRQEIADGLMALLKGVEKTLFTAPLLALLIHLGNPVRRLASLLDSTAVIAGPRRSDEEILARLLETLSAEQTLVIHVVDNVAVDDPRRKALLLEARKNDRLILAFSCRHEDETDEVALSLTELHVDRFDLRPLDLGEIRETLDERFAPNDFPSEIVEALWDVTEGWPAMLAVKAHDLVRLDAWIEDAQGWHLASGGMGSQEVVTAFAMSSG